MRRSIAAAMVAAVLLVLLVPASDAKVITGSGIVMIKDKAAVSGGKIKLRGPAKFIDEAPAVYIAGVWLENSETAFVPWGFFDQSETIDLAICFDWFFGALVDGGFFITIKIQGDTVQGKFKDTGFFDVLMSELTPDSNGCLWFRIGDLPIGRYRIKGAIKGLKPIKGRGKFDIAFDVGDYFE